MSNVTNIVVLVPSEEPGITQLNAYLLGHYHSVLNDVDECSGGNKHLECDVYVGAFNGLIRDLRRAVSEVGE